MRKYTLTPAAKHIICTVVFLLAAGGTALALRYLSSIKILMYVLIGICWAVAVLFGLLLIPRYFRATVIYVSGVEITVHSALINCRRDHLRTSAVQYVTRMSLPLNGLTGFNFLMVRAMGGSLLLPFLRVQDCEEIENTLNLEIKKRG